MRRFKILSFQAGEGVVYSLCDRTGLYDSEVENQESVGELDLLYDGDSTILTVRRDDGVIFRVDDKLNNNNTVGGFGFEKNKMYILDSGENEIPLEEAKLFVKPVEVVKTKDNNNFKELEEKIIKENRAVQLGNNSTNVFTNEYKTLKDFMVAFFSELNHRYNTYYVDTVRVQTEAGKRRSLADIYMICKFYFPKCTLQEVLQLLYVDLYKHIKGFASLKCQMIQKRVWWIFGERERQDHQNIDDEYGYKWAYYIETLKNAPKVEKTLLEQAREKFTKGKRVESATGGPNFTIDTEIFDDGLKFIIVVLKSGKRKIIYDKKTKTWSRIIR